MTMHDRVMRRLLISTAAMAAASAIGAAAPDALAPA